MLNNKKSSLNMKLVSGIFASIAITTMTGCTSLLSIGSDEFDCKKGGEHAGVKCMSATQVYEATNNGPINHVPVTSSNPDDASNSSEAVSDSVATPLKANSSNIPYVNAITGNNPVPVRTPAQVMRVWIGQYEDAKGNLVYPGYVFTEIESRKWLPGERVSSDRASKSPLTTKK